MKQYFVLALLISMAWRGNAQELTKVRPEIMQLVNLIAADTLLNEHIWKDTTADKRFLAYYQLDHNATTRELTLLTMDTNVIVRCYAFYVLAGRGAATAGIVMDHLHDTATIMFGDGRFRPSEMFVGDFFLELVTDSPWSRKLLQAKQIARIDSIIIFDHNATLFSQYQALKRLVPEKQFYQRVREMVTKEKKYNALVALAKYRNQADTEIIISWLHDTVRHEGYIPQEYALKAIYFFPCKAFFPVLSEITLANMNISGRLSGLSEKYLFRAIVQYKDKPSRQLLERAMKEATGWSLHYYHEYIWLALKRYPAPIYDGLLEQLSMPPNRIVNELNFYLEHYDDY